MLRRNLNHKRLFIKILFLKLQGLKSNFLLIVGLYLQLNLVYLFTRYSQRFNTVDTHKHQYIPHLTINIVFSFLSLIFNIVFH